MPKCKKYEAQAIDYAAGELDATQTHEFEQHLPTCSHCIRQVNAIKHMLQLVDSAEAEITPQAVVPPNLETKLYRRLAEEPIEKPPLHTRFSDYISKFGLILQVQKAAIVCLLAVSAIAVTLFVGNPFQDDFVGNPFQNETTYQLNQSESADARIEQYHHQGIQSSMEDVIRNKHHRNSDEWNTVSQLNRVKDQAKGTNWAVIANKHLKRVSPKL